MGTKTNRDTAATEAREYKRIYEQEALISDATELIYELMEKQGVTQSDLAERIGKTKGFVSQVLSGSRNMTLRTLADLTAALDHRVLLEPQAVAAARKYRNAASVTSAAAASARMELWHSAMKVAIAPAGRADMLIMGAWSSCERHPAPPTYGDRTTRAAEWSTAA